MGFPLTGRYYDFIDDSEPAYDAGWGNAIQDAILGLIGAVSPKSIARLLVDGIGYEDASGVPLGGVRITGPTDDTDPAVDMPTNTTGLRLLLRFSIKNGAAFCRVYASGGTSGLVISTNAAWDGSANWTRDTDTVESYFLVVGVAGVLVQYHDSTAGGASWGVGTNTTIGTFGSTGLDVTGAITASTNLAATAGDVTAGQDVIATRILESQTNRFETPGGATGSNAINAGKIYKGMAPFAAAYIQVNGGAGTVALHRIANINTVVYNGPGNYTVTLLSGVNYAGGERLIPVVTPISTTADRIFATIDGSATYNGTTFTIQLHNSGAEVDPSGALGGFFLLVLGG